MKRLAMLPIALILLAGCGGSNSQPTPPPSNFHVTLQWPAWGSGEDAAQSVQLIVVRASDFNTLDSTIVNRPSSGAGATTVDFNIEYSGKVEIVAEHWAGLNATAPQMGNTIKRDVSCPGSVAFNPLD